MLSKIKILSDKAINLIAAGEVVDRPASVVKELVENSIDAGSTEVEISIENGGKNLIKISDNGHGIEKDQIALAFERHATSKLDENDLNNIKSFGFRGEALPSIAAVSEFKISTRTKNSENAWTMEINYGEKTTISPCSHSIGTTMIVRNIFSAIPARLKFLKSDSSEKNAIIDIVERIAVANQNVRVILISDGKTILDSKTESQFSNKIESIFGEKIDENYVEVKAESPSIKLTGFTSIPTYNASSSSKQYFFINNRFIKDKLLFGALKAAYYNLIPDGRHPSCFLFLEIDPYEIDVNVHPAKTEVRFRDSEKVRSFIVGALRNIIRSMELKHASTTKESMITRFVNNSYHEPIKIKSLSDSTFNTYKTFQSDNYKPSELNSLNQNISLVSLNDFIPKKTEEKKLIEIIDHPLGFAKFQIDNTFIVSETSSGFVLVDQHAAHERIVLEQIKKSRENLDIESQFLLIPEVIKLSQKQVNSLIERSKELMEFGFEIERNGTTEVLVRKIPVLVSKEEISILITDIAINLEANDSVDLINKISDEILGNIACHSSIRAGRKMTIDEMNALLRLIETTELAGQCNHGRPTYVHLDSKDIAKIFQR